MSKEEMKNYDQIRGRRRITQEEVQFISIILKIIGLVRKNSFMSNPLLIPSKRKNHYSLSLMCLNFWGFYYSNPVCYNKRGEYVQVGIMG